MQGHKVTFGGVMSESAYSPVTVHKGPCHVVGHGRRPLPFNQSQMTMTFLFGWDRVFAY